MLNLAWATFGPSPIGATDSNHPGNARPAFEQEAETWGEVVCSNPSVRRRSKTSGRNRVDMRASSKSLRLLTFHIIRLIDPI